MIRKLIPLAIPVMALVGGAFAGDMLRAPTEPAASHDAAPTADAGETTDDDHARTGGDSHDAAPADHGAETTEEAWFRFPTQFFVPLMRQGDLADVMILTLTVQTDAASLEALGKKEHALRDALLRQLMIHANTGGFDGNFTADRNLAALRDGLLQAATASTDLPVTAILIEDIARQPG